MAGDGRAMACRVPTQSAVGEHGGVRWTGSVGPWTQSPESVGATLVSAVERDVHLSFCVSSVFMVSQCVTGSSVLLYSEL